MTTTLALGIGRLGTLVEVSVKIFGVFGGPLLGIFFLGVFTRRANGHGALIGGIGGAVAGLIVAFSDLLPDQPLDDVDPRGGDGGHLPPRPRCQPGIRARPGRRSRPWSSAAGREPVPERRR